MKKLERVAALVVKLGGNLDSLRGYGFRRVYTGSASGKIFIHDKKKVVVKQSYFLADKKPKFAVYTRSVKINGGKVIIQPLVRRQRARLAFIRLIDLGYQGKDHKASNCGWYRGKPVLIDW